jgi:hypothetical protein
VFVPATFKALFTQFATVPDALLNLYFQLATMIVDNTCNSVVSDATLREQLLNLLVAHMATLWPTAASAGSGGGIVGNVTSATEGTVSVSAAWASSVSQSMAYFIQTQFGAMFWQLTSPFRSFRYVAPPQCCGPGGAFAGRRGY